MYKYYLSLSFLSIVLVNSNIARSQVVPDNTLSNNTVTLPSGNLIEIQGGTTKGNNLFHSFEQFSVPLNNTAKFNNADNIQNIFSRVTGGNISNINGSINTNGTANLFILNPAGIIFGKDASLNIGGSVFASTGNSFNFSDGSRYSAINPQEPPLLNINLPIGIQYGGTPGNIKVEGNGHNLFGDPETFATVRDNRPDGLQVSPGKTLALLGGEVILEGGNLTAESGNIEIWAVKDSSQLSIVENNDRLSIESSSLDTTYADINLSESASIDVSANSSGDIQLKGHNLTLTDGSAVFADNLGDGKGGILKIETSESIRLIGTTTDIDFGSGFFTEIAPDATGKGSDLIVKTNNLSISGGATISSSNYGNGIPGNLQVTAKNIEIRGGAVIDNTVIGPSGIFSQALFSPGGNGGKIDIKTENLSIFDGANISTLTFGGGNSGDITIKAQDIKLQGTSVDGFPSSITTEVFLGEGNAGKLDIKTEELLLTDGARLTSATFDVGNAGELKVQAKKIELIGTSSDSLFPTLITNQIGQGAIGNGANLTVETESLIITDGAQISTITFGKGNAGNLTVNASESVELKRSDSSTRGGLFAGALEGTGNGGNLSLITKNLTIEDGATITVSNFHSRDLFPPGEGAAGNLDIQANSINLNQGIITAEANSGDKGNINIASEQIILRNNSLLTTDAKGTATGGNIFIDTETLTALENSDITANAVANFAGRVTINATGVFGTESRPQLTPKSDVTATSALGAEFNGVVEINTPESAKRLNVAILPENIINPAGLLTASCPISEDNSFSVTGNGGIPNSPYSTQSLNATWYDLRPVKQENSTVTSLPKPLQEATATLINTNGELELVALAPLSTHRWVKSSCGA